MAPDTVTPSAGSPRRAGVDGNLTAGLDYLARSAPPLVNGAPPEFAAAARRAFRITGIGRDDKFGAALERNAGLASENFVLPTVGLLTGLHEFGSPLSFTVDGTSGRVGVSIGVWTARADLPATQMDERAGVLAAVLRSLYPVVTLEPDVAAAVRLPEAALVLGIPSVIAPTPSDAVVPIDRAIRSLATDDYRVVVLAQPLTAHRVDDLRDEVISEMRWVQAAAHAESLPSPLATDYLELLKRQLATMTEAASTGAWRTAVYLCGTASSLARLEGVWRSTFSGAKSVPEPVRVHRLAGVAGWAQRWALPEVAGAAGTTYLRRPFELQSVLTSAQLAAYIHLPEQEAPGFAVDAVARFDSVVAGPCARAADDGVLLGHVVHAERVTSEPMWIPLTALTKHVLVTGVTGSGKTTTTRHLLTELARRNVPFLVVEPAKAEYRALAQLPELAGRLKIFTVGDESVGPLRINPLAASPGSSVSMHVDLLKSLFSASFGLWPPLPQILERCLHELYADYGWDLATNTNRRLLERRDADGADCDGWDAAFPTLTELHEAVDRYIGELGYQGEVTANMRAALSTRIIGLTVGGKGAALDTRRSTPTEELFDTPAVLELERLADPDDQAFVIGLLMIRLIEHRRTAGPSSQLRHLLVIEEAHRLLARAEATDTGNPRAKAVETFTNLLAEIRSYGQGVLVADQVPVKLAPEVVKNTNLKITHRLVADDDRAALAAAMVMNERQHRALATLAPGRAAVFAEGQDAPVLLAMTPHAPLAPVGDAQVRFTLPDESSCDAACAGRPATSIVPTPELERAFARVAQSLIADAGAVERNLPELHLDIRMGTADEHGVDCVLRRLARLWADRRGRQQGWTFAATAAIGSSLATALTGDTNDSDGSARAFATAVVDASRRTSDPYALCDVICPDGTCLYRHAAAAVLESAPDPVVAAPYEPDEAQRIWLRATDVATSATEFPSSSLTGETWVAVQRSALTTSLCLAQQALATRSDVPSRLRLRLLGDVIGRAPHGATQ